VGDKRTATTSSIHLSSSTEARALPTTHGQLAGSQPPGQVRVGTGRQPRIGYEEAPREAVQEGHH